MFPIEHRWKILIMDNDSGDRSISVQDGENNDNWEQIPILVS